MNLSLEKQKLVKITHDFPLSIKLNLLDPDPLNEYLLEEVSFLMKILKSCLLFVILRSYFHKKTKTF